MCAAAVVVVAVSLLIDGDRTVGGEAGAFHFLNRLPAWLYPVMWAPMQLGNLLVVPAAAIVAAIVRKWRLAAAVLVSGAAKFLFSALIKDAVVRHRPGAFVDDVTLRGGTHALGQGFVSGHATIAAAIATLIHPYLGARGRVLAWTGAALVCIGRMYVGAHLPLDVAGGAALGVAIGSALNLLFGVPVRSTAPMRKEGERP